MREILFRGLASAAGFVYGHLFIEELPSGKTYAAIVKEIDGRWRNVVVDENTVGQFTGLTDANGVNIFEGDIIPYRGENYQVDMCGPSWTLKDYEEVDYYGHDAPELQDWSEFEVIGNIHQNPELLK